MEKVILSGLIRVSTMASSEIIIFKAQDYIHGITVGLTMGPGRITKWKGTEYLLGLMVAFIKGSTSMIKRKVMEYSLGPMVVSTMDSGRTGSKTVKAFTPFQAVNQNEGSGLMGKESLGSEYYSLYI
jgi:hypothetical protein